MTRETEGTAPTDDGTGGADGNGNADADDGYDGGGGGCGGVDPADVTCTEIVAISERIRVALECPICLLVITEPTCRCPNGHVICHSCLARLNSLDNAQRCPMCRSPMALGPHVSCTAAKLTEITAWLKVTCSHRQYGCDELVPLVAVAAHEASCAYKPNVRCLVSTCQWVGLIDGLYEHVDLMHPAFAVKSKINCLVINDANDIKLNQRRSYLVETPSGLFWVKLSYETRCRIRTSVFMVYDHERTKNSKNLGNGPRGMVFRVSWSDEDGKCRTRSRVRRITWSPTPYYSQTNETYTLVRCKKGRLQIVWYDRSASDHENQHLSTPYMRIFVADSLRI